MKNDGSNIRFKPVMEAHLPMLAQWLSTPHMREWWGEPEEELGFIRDMISGRDSTRPFLIVLADQPVGYIQNWFIGHHQNEQWVKDHPWLMELPSETVGVDLSIGDPDFLSKGIGSAALAAFVRRLIEEGHGSIIIDPDRGNARAIRAYAKVGFRPVPHLEGRTGDALIMQYDRHASETNI
ncbi:GNAT family N-acetyltransferase [Nitratireductor luteus]|uniref:GNAT family N-acetyltransferase n=1 Tax=Nitratireductor luteus TaxID=2976980 RepID=UPI00223EEFB3|nr:GNAT family N-acetyltransferase [Nitratireductor luteus]